MGINEYVSKLWRGKMTRLRKMLGTAAAACAAMTLLAGAALAGNPHTPGAPTGKPATPPGQAKEGTNDTKGKSNGHAAKAQGKGQAQHAAKVAAKVATKAAKTHPAHPSHPVTPSHSAATTTTVKPTAGTFASTKGKGHEKTAHHKVIICHRTGSATNPYVVINISINAWLNGHTKHPALDGRSDILLKDPASPGEKMDAAQCGAASTPTTKTTATVQPTTHATPRQKPAKPKKLLAAGGVKGVSSTNRSPRAAGVLGALSSPVRVANLPFTGFPLWIATLLAALLVGSGLLIRRAGRAS